MNDRHLHVVGSGPSGVHFAAAALRKGYEVTMIDVGHTRPPDPIPDAAFDDLKARLDDPVEYFLGERFEAAVLPEKGGALYSFPPSKGYVFEPPPGFRFTAEGFEPLFSFARGGLAEAWTGSCPSFNEAELADFPFSYDEIAPYYETVAAHIGVTGVADDLARFVPMHDHLLPPLPLDPHSELLLHTYEKRRDLIQRSLGAHLGRTRIAVLPADHGERRGCAQLGRCMWGCPRDSLYVASQTLRALQREPGFRYLAGLEVQDFSTAENGRIDHLRARDIGNGALLRIPVSQLALAAGTLSTATIVLRSVRLATGEAIRLHGLMDNRQVYLPFLTFRMLGRSWDYRSYQYHLLGIGLAAGDESEYVHGQITTLKTALMHPIIQQLPLDLRTSLAIARAIHPALGVVNVNFHDRRREDNWLGLDETTSDDMPRLRIHYSPEPAEASRIARTLKAMRRVLRLLGCIVPPGMQQVRPMGGGVHYAGVLPMAPHGRWTVDETCRSRDFPNLLIVDGATFPFLPAKNITFTLMANAVRVAERAL